MGQVKRGPWDFRRGHIALNSSGGLLVLLVTLQVTQPFIIQFNRVIIIKVRQESVFSKELGPSFSFNVFHTFVIGAHCGEPVVEEHMELGRHVSRLKVEDQRDC